MPRLFSMSPAGARPSLFTACAAMWLGACSTGTVSMPGAAQSANTTATATAGSTAGTPPTAANGNTQGPPANANGPVADGNSTQPTSPAAGQTLAVGAEVVQGDSGVDPTFWLGVQAAVQAMAPQSASLAHVVVATAGISGVSIGYPDDGTSGLKRGVTFAGSDAFDALLASFDDKKISVLLEVQPGSADLQALVTAVLNHYKAHPSVAGISVDVEQYKKGLVTQSSGSLSDDDASALVAAAQAVNPAYTVALKHYSSNFLPPSQRLGLTFVFSAKGFGSLDELTSDFRKWASKYKSTQVGFVVAANRDYDWSCGLPQGPAALVAAAQAAGNNVASVTWSNETAALLAPTNTYSCAPAPSP